MNLVTVAGYLLGAVLRVLLGERPGRAMGIVFLFTSVAGLIGSLFVWRDPALRRMEAGESK